jgi:pyruvate/2-oxoglutarate dehydrogenase complex dihydrolipoamide dehydrogenase (E3) component
MIEDDGCRCLFRPPFAKTMRTPLGCHVVGERAVEITQVAAIAITAQMRVDELARVPLSFPTYAGILARVAASAPAGIERGGVARPIRSRSRQ